MHFFALPIGERYQLLTAGIEKTKMKFYMMLDRAVTVTRLK